MNHKWDSVHKFLMQSRVIFGVVILLVFLGLVSCSPGINENSTTNRQTSTPNEINSSAKSVSSNVKIVATATVTKTQKVTLSGCVDNAKYLNVRSGPGTQYGVNSYLSEGDCVTLIERNADSTWVKFSKGWLSQGYLKVNGSVSQLPFSTSIQTMVTNPPLTLNNTSQSISTPKPSPTSAPIQKPTSTQKKIEITGCPTGCTSHKSGCDIKGNISYNTREKIYHVPGQNYYNKTKISPQYGERWFCTEAEARDNGWRKAKN